MAKCATRNCPNEGRKKTPYCRGCASVWYYWDMKIKKFGDQVVYDRQKALEKWQDRMANIGIRNKDFTNVARFFKRRVG